MPIADFLKGFVGTTTAFRRDQEKREQEKEDLDLKRKKLKLEEQEGDLKRRVLQRELETNPKGFEQEILKEFFAEAQASPFGTEQEMIGAGTIPPRMEPTVTDITQQNPRVGILNRLREQGGKELFGELTSQVPLAQPPQAVAPTMPTVQPASRVGSKLQRRFEAARERLRPGETLKVGPLTLKGQETTKPESPVGKLLFDRQTFLNQYGEGSPQVKALDEVIGGEKTQVKLSDERGLRQEFTKASTDFVQVKDSFTRIQAASSDPSPAGDLSLMFNYMKMLDPGSVVRESEFIQVASTGAFGGTLRAAALQFLGGQRLTEQQRADFVGQAGNLFRAQMRSQLELENEFNRVARESKIDPKKIIVDFIGRQRSLPSKTPPLTPGSSPTRRFTEVP